MRRKPVRVVTKLLQTIFSKRGKWLNLDQDHNAPLKIDHSHTKQLQSFRPCERNDRNRSTESRIRDHGTSAHNKTIGGGARNLRGRTYGDAANKDATVKGSCDLGIECLLDLLVVGIDG